MTRHNGALNQQRDLEHHAIVDHAISQAATTLGTADTYNIAVDPADARQLRGIPALTQGGIGSHIQGTRPDLLTWNDDRRKRPRTRNP